MLGKIFNTKKRDADNVKTAKIYNQIQKTALSLRRRITGSGVKEKVFFLHIPKCGGTSVDTAITEAIGPQSCLHLYSAASRRAAEIQGIELMEYRNSLLPYFMEQNGLQYISGHFVFNSDLHSRYSNEWGYVTMLRDPVQKYISQYFYNLQKPAQDHFGIDESAEEFIASAEGVRLGQDMVQKITGIAELTAAGSREQQAQIDLAVRNIEKFRLVGILEDTERFQSDFKKIFGASLHIKKMNRNRSKNELQISNSLRKKIEQLCRPDIALYEHVKKLLYR